MDMAGLSDTLAGAHQTRPVQWGDIVHVNLMAWLEDGTLIYFSSIDSEPHIFTAGNHPMLHGLGTLVVGMCVGESVTERISSDSAFGPYRPELCCQVSSAWLLAQNVALLVGLGLEIRKTDGTLVHMTITGLDGDRVTLDANHRLAGKNVIVQVDLLDVLDRADPDSWATPPPAA
ncbi:MAG: FKBP-type peptidyl-prolyl cis-trans isomerase [Nitrospirota bacterium]|nr:FKBP-type peptidyl-prolyl cis-trans isomerase [Nitrospirota bacterium]MDP3596998.1 FKBP-type peptidyl-prolyl cis-trans isomerase [Nitrospirota bacterium]